MVVLLLLVKLDCTSSVANVSVAVRFTEGWVVPGSNAILHCDYSVYMSQSPPQLSAVLGSFAW